MTTWQSIETAPKDGSTVLVWCADLDASNRPVEFDQHIALAHWSGQHWFGIDGSVAYGYSMGDYFEHEAYFPTHWMPLPSPPGEDPGIPILASRDATEEVLREFGTTDQVEA